MKTLQECKDEVAIKYNKYSSFPYKDWNEMQENLRVNPTGVDNLISRYDEAAELYAQQWKDLLIDVTKENQAAVTDLEVAAFSKGYKKGLEEKLEE